MRLPPLQALRSFEAASRHLSFTRAAEELCVTQGAVSQQVKQLEEYLGLKLFYRLPRKLESTEQGVRLFRATHEAFTRIAAEVEQLKSVERAGVITVSVLQSFAVKWLIPRLAKFRALHPDVDVRIHADDRLIDFRSDGIDVAVRFERKASPGLYNELLFAELIFPVCAPMLLNDERYPINKPADLIHHVLLHDATARGFDLRNHMSPAEAEADNSDWTHWLAEHPVRGVDPDRGVIFNAGDMVVQAAITGQGVAMARLSMAFDDLRSGLLVRPFEEISTSSFSYYTSLPEENMERPQVKVFVDWLRAEAAECCIDHIVVQRPGGLEPGVYTKGSNYDNQR